MTGTMRLNISISICRDNSIVVCDATKKLLKKRLGVNGTVFQCLRLRWINLLRSLHRVDAAFRLGSAAPAAGPQVFIGRCPAGARHASDRHEARSRERMRGQLCLRVDRLDIVPRDICEWIEFQPGAIGLDDGYSRARPARKALASVDPGPEP